VWHPSIVHGIRCVQRNLWQNQIQTARRTGRRHSGNSLLSAARLFFPFRLIEYMKLNPTPDAARAATARGDRHHHATAALDNWHLKSSWRSLGFIRLPDLDFK
jgi:hypothetical protein